MLTDLKYALRQLRKNPGFTLIVVLTLALGIGANTAAFTAINALLLRPLPVRDPAQLVLLARTADEMNPYRFSYPFFQKLRAESKSLSELIATNDSSGDFVATGFGSNQLERVALSQVSGNYFSFFGLSPALGRLLTPDDDRAGAPRNVAVISYRLWQNRFAGDPGVLGKSIQVGPAAFIIVGVAPNGFTGLRVGADTGLWLPLQTITQVDPSAAVRLQSTNASTWLSLIGRLGAGVSRSAAQSETAVIFARIQREVAARLGPTWSPTDRRKFLDDRAVLEAGSSGFNNARYSMPMIIILSTIVVLVFLVACANASGLLLARGSVRQRELGVRLALGASRRRLISQLLTESILLAAMSALLGLFLARWGLAFLLSYIPASTGVRYDLHPDLRVLLFVGGAALATGTLVGLIPALRFSRQDLVTVLKDQSRGSSGSSRQRWNRALVLMQIVVTVCLIASAGLFAQTLHRLQEVNPGFARQQTLFAYVDFDKGYDSVHQSILFKTIRSQLGSIPGVTGVSYGWGSLASGVPAAPQVPFVSDGQALAAGASNNAYLISVGPEFFETLSIPIIRGRPLQEKDLTAGLAANAAGPIPVVVNEALVERYFGRTDPIGHGLHLTQQKSQVALQIVGVARDTKVASLREQPAAEIYLPYFASSTVPKTRVSFQLRVAGNPLAAAAEIPAALHRVDSGIAMAYGNTLDSLIDLTLLQERMIAQLASFFGSLALVLASVGLYGLLAYNVAQRTREIGVRMALGANLRDIVGLVVGQSLALSLVGCAGGIIGAAAVVRVISSRLYGVGAADPLTYAATAALLTGVALLASWVPARRAARVDPMVALRAE